MGFAPAYFLLFSMAALPGPESGSTATRHDRLDREQINKLLVWIATSRSMADTPLRKTIREGAWLLIKSDVRFEYRFKAPGGLVEQESAFHDRLVAIQKNAAYIQFKMTLLLERLKSQQEARTKESSHWQACYDYVCARLELQAGGIYEYNKLLGSLRKRFRFRAPDLAGWRLVTMKQKDVAGVTGKHYTQARYFFHRLMREHPGSHWGHIARQEMTGFPGPRLWKGR